MPTWIEALKMYYSGKKFMIPKKGSEDYDAVKKLMSGKPAAASSPPKMTDAPKKVTVEELRAKYLAKKKAKKAENYVSPLEYHTLVNHAWKVKEMKAAYPYGVMVTKTPEGFNTWREASKADASEFFMPGKR